METQALATFIERFDNIKLYLSFHSYGQLLLFPYVSWKKNIFPKNINEIFVFTSFVFTF